ncbi:hypothetical protein GGI08_009818, partial [Coemansia sp. S2]
MTSTNGSYRPSSQGVPNAHGGGGYAGRPFRPYSQQQQQQQQQKPKPFSAFDALARDGIADIVAAGGRRKANDPFNPDDSDDEDDSAGMESDDPTNTAMFLDDSEEKELHGVPPGTPQAFKKLGQLTVKSITRQKDSQTPGRTQTRTSAIPQLGKSGSAGRNSQYTNNISPSKRGRNDNDDMLPLGAAVPVRPVERPSEPVVPLSVQRLRASQRASRILDNIKGTAPLFDSHRGPNGGVLPLQFGAPANQQPRVNLNPEFDRNEFSPIVFS